MSYDGQAEITAIIEHLKPLAGGRIYEYFPDEVSLVKDSTGKPRPYVILAFGETVLDDTERTLEGDGKQVWNLPWSAQFVAGNPEDLRALAAAAKTRLLEWRPTPSSDEMQVGLGGQSFPTLDADDRPVRFNRIVGYAVRVNLSS